MSDKTDELLNEREKTHGDANETFAIGAKLLNCVKDYVFYPHHFAVVNILHKIARILCGSYNPDHWDDIEGYARLGKRIQEKIHDGGN